MNRRLNEIRENKKYYQELLDNADTISECLVYSGKLECLEREENSILERGDVVV